MSRLGVLQIIDSLNTGGAEVLAVNIANSLSVKNINSHLCSTRLEGKLKENLFTSVGYLYLKKKKAVDFSAILRLKKYLKINKITVIHAHSSSYFIAFCVKLIYPKIKIIWHDHYGISQDLSQRSLFPLKYISYYFSVIIAVNKSLQNWSLLNLKCKKNLFLNNFAFFSNLEKVTTLKEENTKKIVHLAAFRAQKDHKNLIDAFQLFVKNNKHWTLHLVGPISNDLYSEKIIKHIKNNNLENKIFVYGACLDIFNILNQADIGVLSSKSEGLPISILEYGLAKLPVITTNVGECGNVIENNISGYLIDSKNSMELSSKLDILAKSESLRKSFGNKHFRKVTKEYSKEKFTNQIIDIYKSTCVKQNNR